MEGLKKYNSKIFWWLFGSKFFCLHNQWQNSIKFVAKNFVDKISEIEGGGFSTNEFLLSSQLYAFIFISREFFHHFLSYLEKGLLLYLNLFLKIYGACIEKEQDFATQ